MVGSNRFELGRCLTRTQWLYRESSSLGVLRRNLSSTFLYARSGGLFGQGARVRSMTDHSTRKAEVGEVFESHGLENL